jgi:hypothetical protein
MKTKILNRLIIAFGCLAIAINSFGQSSIIKTDQIQWNATGFTDLVHNTLVANTPCQFKTSSTQIDWIQGNGSYVNSFSIIGTSGTWVDLTQAGSIAMSVSGSGLTGTITFSRDQNGITIKVELSGGTDSISNLYTISTFEKL